MYMYNTHQSCLKIFKFNILGNYFKVILISKNDDLLQKVDTT